MEVHAAGINPADWKIREGYMKNVMPFNFPATLGGDFSGVVMQVGEGLTLPDASEGLLWQNGAFKKGDDLQFPTSIF